MPKVRRSVTICGEGWACRMLVLSEGAAIVIPMTNTHEGLTSFGPIYTCNRCACRVALRAAIRAEDWQTVKFISENAPTAHADDCEAPRHPLFEVIAGGLA